MAAFLNDPIAIAPLLFVVVHGIETQPLSSGTGGVAPTISNEIPVPDSTTAPPLTLIEFLVQ